MYDEKQKGSSITLFDSCVARLPEGFQCDLKTKNTQNSELAKLDDFENLAIFLKFSK